MTTRIKGTFARFATENGRFKNHVVKPKLFEPNRRLELSVFQVSGFSCNRIEDLGVGVVKDHPKSTRLYGWGEVNENVVLETGLQIDYDNIPPRHANIIDWPQDSAERKLIQISLASQSTAIRLSTPIQVVQTPAPIEETSESTNPLS